MSKPKKNYPGWQIWLFDHGVTISHFIFVIGLFAVVAVYNLTGGAYETEFEKPVLFSILTAIATLLLFLFFRSLANLKR
ncbi:MAG: hypothetical protein AAFP92_18455 [Bacteroidota bacterium]